MYIPGYDEDKCHPSPIFRELPFGERQRWIGEHIPSELRTEALRVVGCAG